MKLRNCSFQLKRSIVGDIFFPDV